MAATALSYVIFISFIVIVVSPGLFALSKQLLVIMSGFAERLGSSLSSVGNTVKIPIKFEEVAITPEDFSTFAIWSIAVISGFAAMVISIIKDGNIKDGLKYIPFFILTSVLLFKVISFGIDFVMGGLI